MATKKAQIPTCSIPLVSTTHPDHSPQPHLEHYSHPLSCSMNTLSQITSQCIHFQSKPIFSSPKPRILTIPKIDTIVKQSRERIEHVLTRQ